MHASAFEAGRSDELFHIAVFICQKRDIRSFSIAPLIATQVHFSLPHEKRRIFINSPFQLYL